HFVPFFEALGHPAHVVELPLTATSFSVTACVEAIVSTWRAVRPAPVVVGHSLGARLTRAALGVAPIDHAVLLSCPTNAQLIREAARTAWRWPARSLRAAATGRQEELYHHAEFLEHAMFSGTVEPADVQRALERVRAVTYPRWALGRLLGVPTPRPLASNVRVDVIVGALDPTCGSSTGAPSPGSFTLLPGAPHDLMLGSAWRSCAEAIARLVAIPSR
ncbi:MAG: alpha/beta fold hydrolase, partial [Archangium sp.]|nr:alpha/beta fold hydrolase [Archangium sp.]